MMLFFEPMRPSRVDNIPMILVVDDEADNCELLSELLNLEVGCVVCVARHGLEAMAILRNPDQPLPCLILLDWMMPQMNGAEVLSELAKDVAFAAIPVIVCSAALLAGVSGAASILRKPLDMNTLVTLVREHCDRARTVLRPTLVAAAK
jgi:CheY-like chemotaxis protein